MNRIEHVFFSTVVLKALVLARNTINDLNSAYGADNISQVSVELTNVIEQLARLLNRR